MHIIYERDFSTFVSLLSFEIHHGHRLCLLCDDSVISYDNPDLMWSIGPLYGASCGLWDDHILHGYTNQGIDEQPDDIRSVNTMQVLSFDETGAWGRSN